jgi:hypothetical protein
MLTVGIQDAELDGLILVEVDVKLDADAKELLRAIAIAKATDGKFEPGPLNEEDSFQGEYTRIVSDYRKANLRILTLNWVVRPTMPVIVTVWEQGK